MTDTLDSAWIWRFGGSHAMARGFGYWISDESLCGLRCRKGRTGGSCAGGSVFTRRRDINGWADGWRIRTLRTDRAVRTRARSGQITRSNRAFLRCATPIQPGELARLRGAWNATA